MMLVQKMLRFFEGKAVLYADADNKDGLVDALSKSLVESKIRKDGQNGGVTVTLCPSDVKKIAPTLDKMGVIVYINNIYGFKYLCARNFKRVGVLLGITAFLLILLLSTMFVFKIEISGSELISKEQIKSELSEFGIRVGAKLSDIDRADASNRFMQNHPEFSFVAINFKGTTVCVELKERSSAEQIDRGRADFMVAECDGVITRLVVTGGRGMVTPGTVVKKGDLLISGMISGNGLQYSDDPALRYDGAFGEVFAETSGSLDVQLAFEELRNEISSREKCGVRISVFGLDIDFGTVRADLEKGFELSGERNVTVFGSVELPITYRECTRVETVQKKVLRDEAEALLEAEKVAYRKLSEQLGGGFLTEINVSKGTNDSGAWVKIEYGCERNIAVPKGME